MKNLPGKFIFAAALLIFLRAAAADFTVSNVGMTAYKINGNNNPGLTLQRGNTYVFAVSSPGHPFDIKTNSTTGSTDRYNDGITGQGVTSGTLTFAVPTNAPNTLFYHCEIHAAMAGTINLVNPPAPTPATLTNVTLLPDGLVFTILSPANQTNIIQASSDLTSSSNWISLATNSAPSGIIMFTDSAANTFSNRFYRVLKP